MVLSSGRNNVYNFTMTAASQNPNTPPSTLAHVGFPTHRILYATKKGCFGLKEWQQIEGIDCNEVQWLCTLDIKSLYTNIPCSEGIEAVSEKPTQDHTLSNSKIMFIMTLLEIILTKK